ncbi:hypothetical protein NMY22_g5537 [Coprinellus aureogranulatus]|nr:hypothetical protein NMY22_g5537 [Coprinellus aureogranulatus]
MSESRLKGGSFLSGNYDTAIKMGMARLADRVLVLDPRRGVVTVRATDAPNTNISDSLGEALHAPPPPPTRTFCRLLDRIAEFRILQREMAYQHTVQDLGHDLAADNHVDKFANINFTSTGNGFDSVKRQIALYRVAEREAWGARGKWTEPLMNSHLFRIQATFVVLLAGISKLPKHVAWTLDLFSLILQTEERLESTVLASLRPGLVLPPPPVDLDLKQNPFTQAARSIFPVDAVASIA